MEYIFENYNDDINNALLGLFLGDGCYRDGWINIQHTEKQKFYVEWLEYNFEKYGAQISTNYGMMFKTNLGEYMYDRISIKVSKTFEQIATTCYNENNKKIVTNEVLNAINIIGLLFWYLDDGSLTVHFKDNRCSRFAYLNTQSFTKDENEMIQKMFKERFDIDTRIHKDSSGFEKYKDKRYYRIYFNATNFRKFFDLVRPYLKYIPKEFYYKFDMKYFPNRIKANSEYALKYNLS